MTRKAHRAAGKDAKNSCEVARNLTTSWRSQPIKEIKRRILSLQRLAVREHLTQYEWKTLDRMRKHVGGQEKRNEFAAPSCSPTVR
jgi:hypothetical protein